jgi:hypothetical protein
MIKLFWIAAVKNFARNHALSDEQVDFASRLVNYLNGLEVDE